MSSDRAGSWYQNIYEAHRKGERVCQESIHDLDKARRRVQQVAQYFHMTPGPQATALDVGCGLGYFTASLQALGYDALGLDCCEAAIGCATAAFPGVRFQCGSFPQDVKPGYDLVWAVDVSLLNTFDVPQIVEFVGRARGCLKPEGHLIIGWHTDFSGSTQFNWAHWDWATMQRICSATGLQGPAVVQMKRPAVNRLALCAFRLLRKSVPIFLALKRA